MEKEKPANPIVAFITDFKSIILALIAVATAINSFQNNKISEGLERQLQEAEISKANVDKLSAEVHMQLDQKKFSNEQLFQLYKEIKESVNQKNCDQQLLLTMIVDQVMADNVPMRDSLNNFIVKRDPSCTAAKYIQKEKDVEKKFEVEQKAMTSNFTIDVFYLDEIPEESIPRANKIVELLKEQFSSYNIRPRLLPKGINAREGYRIDANEIRFDPEESNLAKEVYDVIVKNKIFRLEQPALRQIGYRSPNYISVFVRNM